MIALSAVLPPIPSNLLVRVPPTPAKATRQLATLSNVVLITLAKVFIAAPSLGLIISKFPALLLKSFILQLRL